MKIPAAPILLLTLTANSFAPAEYETAIKFARALIENRQSVATAMMTSDAVLSEWNSGDNSLAALATYLSACPINSIEGNADRNININLNCGRGHDGVSLHFRRGKISEINFGQPPRINISVEPSN